VNLIIVDGDLAMTETGQCTHQEPTIDLWIVEDLAGRWQGNGAGVAPRLNQLLGHVNLRSPKKLPNEVGAGGLRPVLGSFPYCLKYRKSGGR
jgi:hypothetical protein